mmetsp:Transcript_16066/g.29363  ORF Transcript_16066/g.29363 Transcript_16066/m.29363 type:complete len:300 (+) Transcript_16066:208-1107(+)
MAAAPTPKARQHAPRVNLFDIPELLPGARPNANPAQREEFEERCRLLHRQSEAEREAERQEHLLEQAALADSSAGTVPALADIEAMFPMLDGALVRTIYMEAREPQDALDTLLALSAAAADVSEGAERPATPPPLDLGVEDHEKFPSLVDSEGWQVAATRQFNRDPDEDLGSAWRDRAHAAKHLPAPRPTPGPTAAPAPRRRASAEVRKEKVVEEQVHMETDYEWRHRVGQRRSRNKLMYGGRGRGRKSNPQKADESDDDAASTDSEVLAGGAVIASEGAPAADTSATAPEMCEVGVTG